MCKNPRFLAYSICSSIVNLRKNSDTRASNGVFPSNSLFFSVYLHVWLTPRLFFSFFFYLSGRFCLHNLPRLANTWPSFRRRHCPRQRYFQRAFSLTFPLEVVVHCCGTLFFTWCHCRSNCCVPAVRPWRLLRANSAWECLTTHFKLLRGQSFPAFFHPRAPSM